VAISSLSLEKPGYLDEEKEGEKRDEVRDEVSRKDSSKNSGEEDQQ